MPGTLIHAIHVNNGIPAGCLTRILKRSSLALLRRSCSLSWPDQQMYSAVEISRLDALVFFILFARCSKCSQLKLIIVSSGFKFSLFVLSYLHIGICLSFAVLFSYLHVKSSSNNNVPFCFCNVVLCLVHTLLYFVLLAYSPDLKKKRRKIDCHRL